MWWTIIIVDAKFADCWGYFDHDLRAMFVCGSATSVDLLDTAIHEIAHGLDPSRPERHILRQGNVTAIILDGMGYKI